MRKKYSILVLIILLFILTFFSDTHEKETTPINKIESNPYNNQYIIKANLNTADKIINAVQQVIYVNNTGIELEEIYFHVYPNSFKTEETAPVEEYNPRFIPGYTDIVSLEAATDKGKIALKHEIMGRDGTILRIELPYNIKPSENIVLDMKYIVHIPPGRYRFGYGDITINLDNWYPIAAVYDDKGWNIERYYSIGEPFYSDAADYKVSIEAPKEYTIASTGFLIEEKAEDGRTVWSFEANSVRNFALIACDRYKVLEKNIDGILVKSYFYSYDEKYGKIALEHGIRAIKAFNQEFGSYPYPSFSIVEADCPQGIELSGMVCINDLYYYNDSVFQITKWRILKEPFKRLITRGVARQWWYNTVGHDQINEAWLGGGFTRYCEGLFIELERKDEEAGRNFFWSEVEPNVNSLIGIGDYDIGVYKPLSEFKYIEEYKASVQDKGALLLYSLRQELGDDIFKEILRQYYSKYKFKNASTKDFISICQSISGKNLESFFSKWL